MSIELIKSEINVTRIKDDISSAQKLAQNAWNRARKVDNFTKRLNTTIYTIQEMIATADFGSEAPANEAPVRRDISNLRIEEMTSEVEGIVDRLTRLEGDLTETNSFVYDVLLDDLNKKVDELEQATSSRVNELDKQVTDFVSRSSRDMMKLNGYMKKTSESLQGKVVFSKKTFDRSMKDIISAAKANKEHFRRLEQKVNSHENSEHVIQIVAKDLDN
ncbi:unnamed protein product [Oikopleura dioica]|uniref:Uncharacterized protein n=1 Tax=Oikopleura dioica TaxID=34765 RepID=E4WXB0_OIKDI|nr:unnamed protein product [Oikopleura dioica]